MAHTYDHPRPALTVDCVVFGYDEAELRVLLIQRDLAPFEGRWALPGGFVHLEETLEEAARRSSKRRQASPTSFSSSSSRSETWIATRASAW